MPKTFNPFAFNICTANKPIRPRPKTMTFSPIEGLISLIPWSAIEERITNDAVSSFTLSGIGTTKFFGHLTISA